MKPVIPLLLLLLPIISRCQEIRNLVFEGAGIRGLAYSGAIPGNRGQTGQ